MEKRLIISTHMIYLSCQQSVLSLMLSGSDNCMTKQKSTTPSTTSERKHPPKPLPIGAKTLLTPKGQRIMHTFHKQGHRSIHCVVITNISERREIWPGDKDVASYVLSVLTQQSIVIANGLAPNVQLVYGQSHFSSRQLCASEIQPLTQGSEQPSSAISMCVDNKTSILLQIYITLVLNPTQYSPRSNIVQDSSWTVEVRGCTSLSN